MFRFLSVRCSKPIVFLTLFILSCAPVLAQASAFYFSGGKKVLMEETTDWIAVELEDNKSAADLKATSKSRGIADKVRPSMHHDKYKILVLPLEENATAAQRIQQKNEIKKMKGVRREVRVFRNGKLPPKVETDEFVIQFKENVSRKEIEAMLAEQSATIIRPLGDFAPNGFVARVDNRKNNSFDAANALHEKPGVAFSHPDFIWPKERRYIPNDSIYSSQWHLNNDGSNGNVAGADIKAERAWEITRGDSDVIIAIIDDGLDLGHEDFQANGKLVGHWDFVGNDGDPSPGADDHHGTSCAGLAAAVGNNTIGVSGVAPNCRLMGVRLLGPNQTASTEAAAIAHAKNNGADIISNSWGPIDGLGVSQPCPDVVNSAINDAVTNGRGGKGCVILWAAGNGNESADLDGYASHPQVICVAASDSSDRKAPYSDFGDAIDVTAPGGSDSGDIVTTDRTGAAGYSTGNYTFNFNGTSAATPVVSGIAALILSVEPNLTWSQVRQRLINTADFIDTANATYDSYGHHPWYGYGRVNALLAVGASDTTDPTVTIETPVSNGNYSSFTAASGSCNDVGFGLWRVRVALSDSSARWWNWSNNTWGSTTFSFSEHGKLVSPSGSSWSASLPTLPAGTFEVHAQSIDKADNWSAWSSRNFTIDQGPPTVTFSPMQDGSEFFNFDRIGGTISEPGTVQFMIMDITDGLAGLRYWNGSSWITDANSSSIWQAASMDGTQWSATIWQVPNRSQIREGNYVISARATDTAGNTGQSGISVTRSAADTTLPVVTVGTPSDNAVLINNFLPTLSGTALDPESGIITVSVYLLRFVDSNPVYWNGSSWVSSPAPLGTSYNHTTGVWESVTPLPSGANLPNDTYQVQVSALNGESPAGTKGIGTQFIVDYHPVYVWNGNISSDWNVQANWTPNEVPPTNAIVVIGSGTCDNRHLGSVQIHGVNLIDGTLQTSGMFVKKLNVSGGSLQGGAVNIDGNNGQFNWTAGSIQGVIGILEGATLSAISDNQKTLGAGAVVNNYGTINWGGRHFYNYAYFQEQIPTINNHSNSVFNLTTDGTVFDIEYSNLRFNNEPGALFVKSGGTGNSYIFETTFTNRGEIRTETGQLHFHTLFLEDGGVIKGPGNISTSHGRIETRGETTVDGSTFLIRDGTFHGEPNSTLATTNGGIFDWQSGSISGEIEIGPESVFNFTSNNQKTFAAGTILRNHGYIGWFDNGSLHNYAYDLSQRATLENHATFAIFGDGAFTSDYNPSFFRNRENGLVTKVVGTNANQINWTFDNAGELESQSGTINLNAGGNSSGSFYTAAAAGISFNGGTHTLDDGVRFRGSGTIRLKNGTLSRNGSLLGDEADAPTLEISGGTFNGTGSLVGPMTVNWLLGTISEVINVGPEVDFHCSGANVKNLTAATFNNSGTFYWHGGGAIYSYAFDAGNRSTFNNLNGGVFSITEDGNVFDISFERSFFNNHTGALLTKVDGWGTSVLDDYQFSNSGEIRVETGTLKSTSRLTLDPGASFDGSMGTFVFAGETIVNTPLLSSVNLLLESGVFTGAVATNGTQMATYAGTAPFDWAGGTINGIFGVESGSVINVVGPNTKHFGSGCVFNNKGAVNWFSGKLYNSAYAIEQRTIFNNLSEGSFNLFDDGQVFETAYNRSYFTNHAGAVIAKFGGTGTNVLNHFVIENYGDIYQSTGSLQFSDQLNLYDGSILFGEGTMFWQNSINLNGDTFVYCTVELSNATLTGAVSTNGLPLGSYMGPGILKWLNGSILGGIMIQPGSTWEITGSETKHLGRTVIENFGTMIWKGSGKIYCTAYDPINRATINIYGLFDLQNDGPAFDASYNRSFFNVLPGGILQKSASGGTSVLSGFAFRNGGTIETLSGSIHFTEHLEIDSGGTFRGSIAQTSGDTWLHGTTFVSSGIFTLAGGNFHGGDITNNAAIATGPNNAFEWTGGTIHGAVAITPGANFNLAGATKTMGPGSLLNNFGNVNWSEGNLFNSAYYEGQPATINNRSGGTWNITGDVSLTHEYNPSTFNNNAGAILRKSDGIGAASCSWILNQSGMLDIQSGKLVAANTFNLDSGSTTSLLLGGTAPLSEYSQLEQVGNLTLDGTLKLTLYNSFTPTNGMAFTLATYGSVTGEFVGIELPALSERLKWKLTYGPTALIAEVVAVTSIQNPTTLEDGTFQFSVSGDPASAAILEGSVDLQVWIPLLTNSPFTGNLNFSDPDAVNATNKFYRVVIIE